MEELVAILVGIVCLLLAIGFFINTVFAVIDITRIEKMSEEEVANATEALKLALHKAE